MVSARPTLAALALTLTASAGCAALPEGGVARGAVLYQNCSQCHGAQGEGSTLVQAPPIASMPAWYIEEQVLHFQWGWRGAHPDDVEGLKMRPMSRTIKSDADVKLVAEYVASLPAAATPATLTGDGEKGKAGFATCTACHGADGAGNEAMKAPPINQLPDWYIVRQIGKFKAGIRGYQAEDTAGATMKGIAGTVADDAAARDLAAYIQTL